MNFGEAIEQLKAGRCVYREGWNGKDMYLFLNPGSFPNNENIPQGNLVGGVSFRHFQYGGSDTALRMPNINMRGAKGETITGWLASQTDMLAEDWDVVLPRVFP